MTNALDEFNKCRCGRGTFLVPGTASLRTCSKCGYLAEFCRCKRVGPPAVLRRVRSPDLTDRTRAIVGAAVFASMATLFFITLFSSPFVAIVGLGIPLALNGSFFVKWLTDNPTVAEEPLVVPEVAKAERRPLVNTG
ncbi:MAG: hypothetical protein JRN06_03120 [Nitrososphaerota archaeon]|nr:hypothetical protein [Nitrososphaerota archaeon]MDG7023150.1 hypothetical protein [Nitrososphaerota archaeon]